MVFNRIVGKSMLKNKSPQIAREYMSSYVEYLCNERIISYVIVECDSNEKQIFKAADNNVTGVTTPALNTNLREVPMLGIERRCAR